MQESDDHDDVNGVDYCENGNINGDDTEWICRLWY